MALRTPAAFSIAGLKPRTSPPLMATSRISHRDLSFGVRRFGTPAHSPAALGRHLDNININGNGPPDENNLMLVAERYPNNGPHNLSLLSIENKSLKPVEPNNRPNFSRLNSSAGYEFLAGCDKWVVLGSDSEDPFLWDPTTDEVRPIPQFQVKPLDNSFWGVGFDSGSGDYKVVRCCFYFDHEPPEIRGELLSVGTGLWREIYFPHYPDDIKLEGPYIHINGFYYWPTFRGEIVIFDFGREEWAHLIPLPDHNGYGWYSMLALAEYHGSLAAIFEDDEKFRRNSLWLQIWVWSNGDRSWSHLSTFHIPADLDVKVVVGLYNNDKVILLDRKGAILFYDLRTTELGSFGVIDGYGYKKGNFHIVHPHYSKSKRNLS